MLHEDIWSVKYGSNTGSSYVPRMQLTHEWKHAQLGSTDLKNDVTSMQNQPLGQQLCIVVIIGSLLVSEGFLS